MKPLYSNTFLVATIAFISRLSLLIFQILSNNLLPDHNADAFKLPFRNFGNESLTNFDRSIDILLSGFANWDANYMLYVARFGYPFENMLAFLPMYPLIIRYMTKLLHPLFILNVSYGHLLLVCGSLLNIVFFIGSTIILYHLSLKKLLCNENEKKTIESKDKCFYPDEAVIITLFFIFNPASIFFSACYSESLYTFLTFLSLYLLSFNFHNNSLAKFILASFILSLAFVTRFVGLFNIIYLLHSLVVFYYDITNTQSLDAKNEKIYQIIKLIFRLMLYTSLCIIIIFIPFYIYSLFAYNMFCTIPSDGYNTFVQELVTFSHSNYILEEAKIAGYHISPHLFEAYGIKSPTSDLPIWCSYKNPFAFYTSVQNKYWFVGLFTYYTPLKIPCFILAAPIVYYFTTALITSISVTCNSLRVRDLLKLAMKPMVPYIIHGSFLLLLALCVSHVEITTRLVCSSSPLLYWYLGRWMVRSPLATNFRIDQIHSSNYVRACFEVIYNFFRLLWRTSRCYTIYVAIFIGVGTLMHTNYLPWT